MILGYVRDYLPRVLLTLPGRDGPISAEFIVDTGFDGDLSLPASLLNQLDATFSTERIIRLADGSIHMRPYYEIMLDWDGEDRLTEITVLENVPLLGAVLMDGFSVDLEMTTGGVVQLERLRQGTSKAGSTVTLWFQVELRLVIEHDNIAARFLI